MVHTNLVSWTKGPARRRCQTKAISTTKPAAATNKPDGHAHALVNQSGPTFQHKLFPHHIACKPTWHQFWCNVNTTCTTLHYVPQSSQALRHMVRLSIPWCRTHLVLFPPPWTEYRCYGPPPHLPPYPVPWPILGPNYAPPPFYPQAPTFPPHAPTQTQPPVQSSQDVPDISQEIFEKIMATIKVLQYKMEEDKAKKATKCRPTPPETVNCSQSGVKILSSEPRPHVLRLEPQPVLSLELRPMLALEPRPTKLLDEDHYFVIQINHHLLSLYHNQLFHKRIQFPCSGSRAMHYIQFRTIARRLILCGCHSIHRIKLVDNNK